ncbi:aspartate/glutamate racemase family protein [Listeria costaricensis]|uniref:aspartate/glutamate racemase family protein n=1 Tax=Listeria costaricensis TaxID=2026604 RepID=UPI000C08B617|nr:aspartate/glutamate racemase family protein [Listeria costaricensis]
MRKIAIIHTTAVTIESLKKEMQQTLPEYEIVNFLDDSILPELIETQGELSKVKERLLSYTHFAVEQQVDAVLYACSSVGEIAEMAVEPVPVLRIDEAMAREAVEHADQTIAVLATLPTTLKPTVNLLKRKTAQAGKNIEVTAMLETEAYRCLQAGDAEGHDARLAKRMQQLLEKADVVVLAQASMARAAKELPETLQNRILSSPESGIQHLKNILAEKSSC